MIFEVWGLISSGPRYMICVTLFARCTSQKTHGHARIACETGAILACPCFTCNSGMSVCFLTRATCKNVLQNLIPRATA